MSVVSGPLSLEEVHSRLVADMRSGSSGSRTTTLNLVCCARDCDDAQRLAESLAILSRRHPGRLLMIVPARDAAGSSSPGEWVGRTVKVESASSGQRIVCEILQLEGSGRAFQSASTAIVPFLVGELPVFLWWRVDNPIDNPRFRDLASVADRVLLNSQELAFHPEQFLQLADLQSQLRHRCCITDLVWAYVTRWRQLLAQAFETAEAAGNVMEIDTIEFVACCSQPALNGAALLLAGWLASRLHWQPSRTLSAESPSEPASPERTSIEVRDPKGRTVVLTFKTSDKGDTRGLLHSVDIRLKGNNVELIVVRNGDRIALLFRQDGITVGQTLAETRIPNEVDALREELDIVANDPVFQSSMKSAVSLLRTLGVSPQTHAPSASRSAS